MNHLEQLIYEYYDWQGYIVKHNVKVGRLKKGGWEGELDIIAFNPKTNHLIHLEPSIGQSTWENQQNKFERKFNTAKKHLHSEVFDWIDKTTEIEQCAIIDTHPKGRDFIGGGHIKSIDEMIKEIRDTIFKIGNMERHAISEQYPLLRTIQLVECGYYSRK